MTTLKQAKMFPCAVFFADGHPVAGVIAALLQATLIFWPVASRWASVSHERIGVERMLGELSESNRIVVDSYEAPQKRFRQLA